MPESGTDQIVQLDCGQSVIIVGANGAGKTRLGTSLDENPSTHRISAQKSLTMPEFVRSSNLDIAQSELLSGRSNPVSDYGSIENAKRISRWGQKPNTFLLDDFEKLMTLLFSEEATVSIEHRHAQKSCASLIPVPQTRLDIVKAIWELVLPHRELIISGGKIETQIRDSDKPRYNAAEMSDGERVIFYLIGQALAAPENGTIIIDEPELHLHRSIQARLWREIQNARPDCLFVYLTHDVEFAASLTEAKKIWLKSFNGQVWEWEEVPEVEGFPEELLLQVLGTRRPILFVEGDNGSLDVALFRFLYPEHTVIPRASCHEVIQSVTTLRALPQIHHLRIHGIIDRDRRPDNEIEKLKTKGIETLIVAEVENLFWVPEVLQILARQMGLPAAETLAKAQEFVFRALQKELETQISLHVANEVQFRLNQFNGKTQGQANIEQEVNRVVQGVDVVRLYSEVSAQFQQAIEEQDYSKVLRLYNRKTLAGQISKIFNLADLTLPHHILRLAQGEHAEELRQAFSFYLPRLV